MYEILGMSSGIDDRPSLLNNQVTTYFVCSVKHYPHTISVNDHHDLMFKQLAFLIWVRWFDSRLFQYSIQTFLKKMYNIYIYEYIHTGVINIQMIRTKAYTLINSFSNSSDER